jgi:hypothetical protein
MRAQVSGTERLRAVARDIKATGDKGLGRQMSAGLRAATKPVQAAVMAEAQKVLPAAGGYRKVFTQSVKFRNAVRAGTRNASVRMVTFADGTRERRDIRALNKGVLRHPVYGRSRNIVGGPRVPNPWAVTTITAGFWTNGVRAAGREAEQEMLKVLDDMAERLAGR